MDRSGLHATNCLDAGSLGKARSTVRDMVLATGRSRVGFVWWSHEGALKCDRKDEAAVEGGGGHNMMEYVENMLQYN